MQTSPGWSVVLARPMVAHAVAGLRPVFESFPPGDTYRTTACAGAIPNEMATSTAMARHAARARRTTGNDAKCEMFTRTSCAGAGQLDDGASMTCRQVLGSRPIR